MSTSAKGITFEEALTRVSSKFNLKYHFKLEQVECMRDLAEGKNVFAVLPTGYGKSDIFGFLPAVMNEMNPDINHHALVVSPLRALMRDQVARWSELGIEAVAILQNCEMSSIEVEGLDRGHYKIIFMSPEILHVEKWVSMLKKHRNTFCLVAFDEVHCLVEWGGTFRPVYKQLGKIRSLLPDAPIVALTATANDKVKHMVIESLHMEYEDFSHIAVVPNRANIFLTIDTDKQAAIEEKLQWYSILLRQKLNHAPKCVIYVRSLQQMTDIYAFFEEELGENLFFGASGKPGECLVEMFYGDLDSESQEALPIAFKDPNSTCRCMVATIAFGMGIQISDIEYILHWGPPKSVLHYWQEVGRGGRDGRDCHAILYTPPHSLHSQRVDAEMIGCVKDANSDCIRNKILNEVKVEGISLTQIRQCCGGPKCCSFCAQN